MKITPQEYLEISQADADRCLHRIMEEFDFEKAAAALHGCGWTYKGAAESPSTQDLKELAAKLIRNVMEMGSGSRVSQGPLQARSYCFETPAVVTVDLDLIPVSGSACMIDGRVCLATTSDQIQDDAPLATKEGKQQ